MTRSHSSFALNLVFAVVLVMDAFVDKVPAHDVAEAHKNVEGMMVFWHQAAVAKKMCLERDAARVSCHLRRARLAERVDSSHSAELGIVTGNRGGHQKIGQQRDGRIDVAADVVKSLDNHCQLLEGTPHIHH